MKLLDLNRAAGKGFEIPAGTAVDWPAMAWRGMHVLVNGRTDLPALATLLMLIVTGYLLYYFVDEETRPAVSALHWVTGLAFPVGFGPFWLRQVAER